ncbi:MAG: glycoside hydrolase family 27 protein, partial [Bacteroidota bacterium]
RNLKIVVGDVLSLTPPLGWNSWNCWGLSVSDEKVRQSADAMKSSGLTDHGWSYINIDDGWEDKHDKDGNILTNSKFPDMKSLSAYIHSLGMKIGIYSSPGRKTCGGYEGSFGFEEKDAQNYAFWGIDYLKYDWCSYGDIAPNPTPEQMKHPYYVMKHALRQINRDIHYSLCQYGMGDVWTWGAEVDGNSWRTTGDIEDTWESLSDIGFNQDKCSSSSGPGRWNDPDMLVIGQVGWGPNLHYTRLTPDEQYTHISLWCLLASPLLIGCDLNQLDPFTLSLLTNDEVLAVNQDPAGKQAVRVKKTTDYEIWVKEMEDGSKSIGLFNKTLKPLNVPLDNKDLSLRGKQRMRDLWSQTELGQVSGHFEMKVMPHGARLISLCSQK